MDISAVLTIASEVAGASGLVTVSSSAAKWMKKSARLRQEADLAKDILGLRQGRMVAYRHDSRHVLYTGSETLHPDNLHGLVAASGNDYVRARQMGRLRIEDEIRAHATHDLVLIGSPTAEGLSRLLFGYEPDGDADSLALGEAPVDLAYRWVLSKNQVAEGRSPGVSSPDAEWWSDRTGGSKALTGRSSRESTKTVCCWRTISS